MAKKKTETDIDSLLGIKPDVEPDKEEVVEIPEVVEPIKDFGDKDIKQYELGVAPGGFPLQAFAKQPTQTFNNPLKDASKGVGGSYYIDATGARVKRTK